MTVSFLPNCDNENITASMLRILYYSHFSAVSRFLRSTPHGAWIRLTGLRIWILLHAFDKPTIFRHRAVSKPQLHQSKQNFPASISARVPQTPSGSVMEVDAGKAVAVQVHRFV